jgi:D-amino-acid dehydrogenase
MKVCVIGAGVIGLTTAYFLSKAGCQVVVLEKERAAGQIGSYANGGQLSYSYVAPLASPSLLAHLPRHLFSGKSPIQLRLAFDSNRWRWFARLLWACRARRSAISTQTLLQLAEYSRQQLDALLSDCPIEFAHRRNGKLVIYRSDASYAAAKRQAALLASAGCTQRILEPREVAAIEPALAPISNELVGGVHTATDDSGDCAQFCDALARHLETRLEIRYGTDVRGFDTRHRRVLGVLTSDGDCHADSIVLAAGVSSAAIARRAGIHLPIYPLKGHSLTMDFIDPAHRIVSSITDYDNKILLAPVGKRLRAAGFFDMVGYDSTVDSRRISQLRQAIDATLPGLASPNDAVAWAGLRPATPSSLPIIGRSSLENLYFNVGHGALGWTLACGSASVVTSLVQGNEPGINRSVLDRLKL